MFIKKLGTFLFVGVYHKPANNINGFDSREKDAWIQCVSFKKAIEISDWQIKAMHHNATCPSRAGNFRMYRGKYTVAGKICCNGSAQLTLRGNIFLFEHIYSACSPL